METPSIFGAQKLENQGAHKEFKKRYRGGEKCWGEFGFLEKNFCFFFFENKIVFFVFGKKMFFFPNPGGFENTQGAPGGGWAFWVGLGKNPGFWIFVLDVAGKEFKFIKLSPPLFKTQFF